MVTEIEKRVKKLEIELKRLHRQNEEIIGMLSAAGIEPAAELPEIKEPEELPPHEQLALIKMLYTSGRLDTKLGRTLYKSLWDMGTNPEVAIKAAYTGIWDESAMFRYGIEEERRREWLK